MPQENTTRFDEAPALIDGFTLIPAEGGVCRCATGTVQFVFHRFGASNVGDIEFRSRPPLTGLVLRFTQLGSEGAEIARTTTVDEHGFARLAFLLADAPCRVVVEIEELLLAIESGTEIEPLVTCIQRGRRLRGDTPRGTILQGAAPRLTSAQLARLEPRLTTRRESQLIELLGEWAGAEDVHRLLPPLLESDTTPREAICAALAETGGERGAERLLHLAGDGIIQLSLRRTALQEFDRLLSASDAARPVGTFRLNSEPLHALGAKLRSIVERFKNPPELRERAEMILARFKEWQQ